MLTLRKHAIKEDEPYAPPSLYLISCGFLRHLKDKKATIKIFSADFRKIFGERLIVLLHI